MGKLVEMASQLRQIVEGFLSANSRLGVQKVAKQSDGAVFNAGDKGHFMFIVGQGQIEISRNGEILESVVAGGAFSKMAFVKDEGTRSADAITASF